MIEASSFEARQGFQSRIANLSPEQRTWLAAQLGEQVGPAALAAGVRLAAYVSPSGTAQAADLQESVRRFLKEKLPEYMQPAVICVLPALPHTPNGTLDRAALPDPLESRPAAKKSGAASEDERQVAQLWESLLGMEGIATDDNFFELGGHSLLVTRLLAQLHQWWGVEIPVRAFFQEPTIAGLMNWKDQARSAPEADGEREAFSF
jgi:acyl carrier protein